MMRLRLDSPLRLAALTVVGGLLATFGSVCGTVRQVNRSLPLLLACIGLVLVGVLGLYWGASTLRDDVQNERWPEETIEPFRAIVRHPAWTSGMIVLLVLMFAALLWKPHHRGFFWGVFLLLQAQTQLGSAFPRRLKRPGHDVHLDWSKIAPLRSDHWGQH